MVLPKVRRIALNLKIRRKLSDMAARLFTFPITLGFFSDDGHRGRKKVEKRLLRAKKIVPVACLHDACLPAHSTAPKGRNRPTTRAHEHTHTHAPYTNRTPRTSFFPGTRTEGIGNHLRCNPDSGHCDCLPGVGGSACDRCLPAAWGFNLIGVGGYRGCRRA